MKNLKALPGMLTAEERREYASLSKQWACRSPRLTRAKMLRCLRLQRKDNAARRALAPVLANDIREGYAGGDMWADSLLAIAHNLGLLVEAARQRGGV